MKHGLRSGVVITLVVAMLISLMAVPAAAFYSLSYTQDVGSNFSVPVPCDCEIPDTSQWMVTTGNCVKCLGSDGDHKTLTLEACSVGEKDTVTFHCEECGAVGSYTITVKDTAPEPTPEPTPESTPEPTPEPTPTPAAPGLYLSEANLTISEGESEYVYAWKINDVTVNLTWSSSDTSVVDIVSYNESCVLHAKSQGQSLIRVTDTISGESDSCYVYVDAPGYEIHMGSMSGAVYNLNDSASSLVCNATLYKSSGEKVDNPHLDYQWYYGDSIYTCTNKISGATGSTYTPSTSTVGTTYYACVAEYNIGAAYAQGVTAPVSVQVLEEDYVVVLEAGSSRLSYGDSSTLTATVYTFDGKGNPVAYKGGATLYFSSDDGHVTLSKTSATTNSSGVATLKLTYDSVSASQRTAKVTVTARINGGTIYDDHSFILDAYNENSYSISLKSDASSLAYGETANLDAYIYRNNNLITSSNYKITWSLRNANNSAYLDDSYTTTYRGEASNELYASVALSSARTVTVVASVVLDGTTYTATKDITIRAAAGSLDITSIGTSFGSKAASKISSTAPSNSAYVVFNLPSKDIGVLYVNKSSAFDSGSAVRSGEYLYLNSNNKGYNLLRDVFFLPAADCSGTVTLSYTYYNTSGTRLGTGSIAFNVTKQSVSSYFYDVRSSWCADAIDFMAMSGMVKGTTSTTYSPSATVTRGMLLTILYRASGSPYVTTRGDLFTDVKNNDYYHDAVIWAYTMGYADAQSSTKFGANNVITREEICSILWRLAGRPSSTSSLSRYSDVNKISSSYYTAVSWNVDKGYLKGSGYYLNPQGSATRAEVAVMLHRYFTE